MSDDINELLDETFDFCIEQLEEAGDEVFRLSTPIQTVLTVYNAQGIIDNGGFQYFFENDFPQTPPYSFFSDAYRRIGAECAADNIDKAARLFGFENPHLDMEKRQRFLDEISEDEANEDSLFHRLGDEICGDDSVFEKLADYIKQNIQYFRKNNN